ncbi:MAG: methionine synthase [Synergistaceae bacterium]|nr:methionine synthase [Synergistaceae bacterium]MBQ9403851.1 methionine synthase [Synergistaceae bacterium]MBR0203982.1 methionine synthase [Synergistaceae bacterium]
MKFLITDELITDALRYMRVPSSVHDEELIRTVTHAFERLETFVQPRYVWGRFPIIRFDGGIELAGAYIYSEDIERLTSRSSECILLAATLGLEVDRQITISQQKNMLDGLALDACASVRIDAFIDQFVKSEIYPELHEGEFMTSRFSPGYGDLGMNVIEDIITILNATKRIGLSVTRSLMMTPVKSVTAVAGLAYKSRVNCHE